MLSMDITPQTIMKISSIIKFVLIALFVYWGATTDTLYNYISDWSDKTVAWLEGNEDKVDQFFDYLNNLDEDRMMRNYNMAIFICSCVAFVLSLLYRLVLGKSAKQRGVYDNLSDYTWLAAVAVLLTAFKHDSANWWAVPSFPIFMFIFIYPLLYIPYYRYLRWIPAFIYDALTIFGGFVYVALVPMYDGSLVCKIMLLLTTLGAFWFMWAHRKFDTCRGCKKYVYNKHIDRHIDETVIDYRDVNTTVATGYETIEKYDKYGHKVGSTTRETGWKRAKYTIKTVTKYHTDTYECCNCGHQYTETGSEEYKKSLPYEAREEEAGKYQGDLDVSM